MNVPIDLRPAGPEKCTKAHDPVEALYFRSKKKQVEASYLQFMELDPVNAKIISISTKRTLSFLLTKHKFFKPSVQYCDLSSTSLHCCTESYDAQTSVRHFQTDICEELIISSFTSTGTTTNFRHGLICVQISKQEACRSNRDICSPHPHMPKCQEQIN